MITRILVPTDFSEPSDAALAYARSIARGLGATLHVLHVIDAASPAVQTELAKEAKLRFARRILPSDKVRYSATREIAIGNVGETIVQSAVERNVDLIVMGAHGVDGGPQPRLGGVAEHVMHAVRCAVLIVRGDGRQRIPIEERAAQAISA